MISETNMLTSPVAPRDHVLGAPEAPVIVVEYGDYECQFCGQAHKVVSELMRSFGKQMRYVYRQFPLTAVHPHAQQAAEAAEAAGAQDDVWKMHDMLYRHQRALDMRSLTRHAALIGLDLPRFANDLARHVHAPRVREDFLSGLRSGVNGTPTFFINGFRHNGPFDVKTLGSAIEAAIEMPAHAP
ncbi:MULTISPECIES: thioredoxin domain-containing protein [Rhodomicrobium]|uniref:DsbA family protein n=1 Tax=Rhodomicrobium TaxID=1068 RepID=UPI001AECD5F9|nr:MULTISPECIES: thioredoxin domain-containing protein [Rhodomicrobium]